METLVLILATGVCGAGIGLALIGGIWILIVAFQEHVLWGLGCLCVPIVPIAFLIMHWDETRKPFLVYVAGMALFICGVGIYALGRSLGFVNG